LGVSKISFVALVAAETQLGDVIIFVQGSELPMIVRSFTGRFQFVRECYVLGVMDGSFWYLCADLDPAMFKSSED